MTVFEYTAQLGDVTVMYGKVYADLMVASSLQFFLFPRSIT